MNSVVVVESPAKAKTIEGYLGDSYSVIASFGHVRDMEDKDGAVVPGVWSDIKWSLNKKGKEQIKEIVQLLKNADRLILATDPDREGEAIAWHVYSILEDKGVIQDLEVRRAVFNSITKTSVTKAMTDLREINEDKVQAYLARRILDYVVGFNISPLLWRRLPGAKSAGRVQSVALKLICERESDREEFKADEYWSILGNFKTSDNKLLSAKLSSLDGNQIKKFDINSSSSSSEICNRVQKENYKISGINKKPIKRNPKPPFITTTLQREAFGKLGFDSDRTMRIAQKLHETGLITYMRTDSVIISTEGSKDEPAPLEYLRQVITNKYGMNYLSQEVRVYKTKTKAQEGHEAIRPTDPSKFPEEVNLIGDEQKLYRLIWNRALASQMKSADLSQTEVIISALKDSINFRAIGSQVVFSGFLKVHDDILEEEDKDSDEKEGVLPSNLKINDILSNNKILPEQHFTKPPSRFSEASLIKELEERGIGRPSTYSSIMNRIKNREYATLENKQFKPANKGRVVVSFLESYFSEYFKYEFTAEMEESLDEIARGDQIWTNLLDKFWQGFEPNIKTVLELSNREVLEKINQTLTHQLFPKGNSCPACGGTLSLKNSPKYGPFIGCTNYDEKGCDYKSPPFLTRDQAEAHEQAKDSIGINPISGKEIFLKPSRGGGLYLETEDIDSKAKRQTIPKEIAEKITFEEALKWIELPRSIGLHPDTKEMIEAGFARGPFVRVKKEGKETFQYANIPAEEDIFSMGMNRAVELLAGKNIHQEEAKELGKDPTSKLTLYLKHGRYGSYIETDELIRKTVPKDLSPEEVTIDWAINNLPIICYHPSDSRPVGIRRQRTRSKGWKAFIVHAGVKKELPKDIKVKDVDEMIALSLLE